MDELSGPNVITRIFRRGKKEAKEMQVRKNMMTKAGVRVREKHMKMLHC